MKRTILFSLAVIFIAACKKDIEVEVIRQELLLTNSIEAVTEGNTSAAAAGTQAEQIAENETVWTWVSDTGNGGTPLYNSVKLTASAGGTLSGEKLHFPESGDKVDIRALHGTFSPTFEPGANAFPASIRFSVAEDQSDGDEARIESDLLYAAADGVVQTGNPTTVRLVFYHMLAKLELQIEKADNVTDNVTRVTLSDVILDGTFIPESGADLSQQSIREGMVVAGVKKGVMSLGTELKNDGLINEAVVVPQRIGNKKITVTLSDGRQFEHSLPEDWRFESGKRSVYTIYLTSNDITVTGSVEPWDESEGEITGEALNVGWD